MWRAAAVIACPLPSWLVLCVSVMSLPHAVASSVGKASTNITLVAHKSNDVPTPSFNLPGQCSVQEWINDIVTNTCPYKAVSGCQANDINCPSGTDCEDCDPCQAIIGGYGGCDHCISIPGCSWCKSSGTCRSTAVTVLFWTSTGEALAPCGTGWERETCDASNDLVAGQSFTDPAAPHQRWFLEAINVGEAWGLGYTGAGLNILFMDDGLDIDHLDFKHKFSAAGSPRGMDVLPNHPTHTHGTRVAGFAAAAANNNVCGVGVAHGSTVSMANFYDSSFLQVFTHGVANNVNHISSNSWGIDACPRTAPLVTTSQPYNVPADSSECPFNSDALGSPCGSTTGCMDWPNWLDSESLSCSTYAANQWCTPEGGEGLGWNNAAWGPIEAWASNGVDAYDACCACGGGCSNMDWNGNSISASCVAVIRRYCSLNLGPGKGLYDPACADHWDLWIECSHKGLHHLYNLALQYGVHAGRGGNGIVYVFSSGNEFVAGDNANFEGWQNSIFTISVGATALDSEHAYYSTSGAPVLVCAPGGETDNGKMPSALPGSPDGCGNAGSGTSFAAPLVSGTVALMLEANPNLGWRDVQDILVRTAAAIDAGHSSWVTNGAGLRHSDMYGFGIINAGAAVVMSRDWPASSSKEHALLGRHVDVGVHIPSDADGVQCGLTISASEASHISSIEHVVVYITTEGHPVRGELRIVLTSPSGTESIMAWTTSADSTPDYNNFKFMTVKNWGESADGTWTLKVVDERANANSGTLVSWVLAIYGKCSTTGADCRKAVMPELCTEECPLSNDGVCNDGGVDGELPQHCFFGSDCMDCGARLSIRAFDVVDRNIQLTTGSAMCDGQTTTSSTSTSTSTGVCPVGYQQAIIDLEDLQAGTQPSEVCLGGGGINTQGWLPTSGGGGIAPQTICVSLNTTGDNAGAMLFDATCGQEPGGTDRSDCSGRRGAKRRNPGDTDLFQPSQGNVLILQTNRANYPYSDPNDDRDGGCLIFDFETTSFEGSFSDVLVSSVTLLDIQNRRAKITAHLKDGTANHLRSERGENGGIQTVDIDLNQVKRLDVCLMREGAVDDITLCLAPRVTETRRLRQVLATAAGADLPSTVTSVEDAAANAAAPIVV